MAGWLCCCCATRVPKDQGGKYERVDTAENTDIDNDYGEEQSDWVGSTAAASPFQALERLRKIDFDDHEAVPADSAQQPRAVEPGGSRVTAEPQSVGVPRLSDSDSPGTPNARGLRPTPPGMLSAVLGEAGENGGRRWQIAGVQVEMGGRKMPKEKPVEKPVGRGAPHPQALAQKLGAGKAHPATMTRRLQKLSDPTLTEEGSTMQRIRLARDKFKVQGLSWKEKLRQSKEKAMSMAR